jgi:hypothetical protein
MSTKEVSKNEETKSTGVADLDMKFTLGDDIVQRKSRATPASSNGWEHFVQPVGLSGEAEADARIFARSYARPAQCSEISAVNRVYKLIW